MNLDVASTTSSIVKLGALAVVCLALVGLVGWGAHTLNQSILDMRVAMAEMTAEIRANTEAQDDRFREFQTSQTRLYEDLLDAFGRSTAVNAAVCLASANGDPEARRICQDAMIGAVR